LCTFFSLLNFRLENLSAPEKSTILLPSKLIDLGVIQQFIVLLLDPNKYF